MGLVVDIDVNVLESGVNDEEGTGVVVVVIGDVSDQPVVGMVGVIDEWVCEECVSDVIEE